MAEHNPYVGPRPFTAEERHLFFGRAEEIEILTGMVVARRASLLYAQSGAGKSSLLMAGLAPRLLHTERVVRGRHVVRPLVRGVRIAKVGRGIEEQRPANVFVQSSLLSQESGPVTGVGPSATLETGLAVWLGTTDAGGENEERLPFLLIFDQFEELFTRHLGLRNQREDFFLQVTRALEDHEDLRVMFSMREDYVAELTPFAHLLPDQLRPRFRLERLKATAAEAAVAEPARQASPPRPFQPGVAEALVSNLKTPQADDVEPILLQVVCKRLWKALPEDRSEIEPEDTKEHADVDRALIEYYNDAVKTAVKEAVQASGKPIAERRVRRAFSQQLITPGFTRAIVFRDEKSGLTAGLPNSAIDVLTRSDVNILRGEARGGGHWYELAHDRLIRPVLSANEEWETANATRLSRRAAEWNQRGRRDQDLLQRGELRDEEARLRTNPDEPLTPIEEELLAKSRLRLAGASAAQRLNIEELGWAVVFAEADPHRDRIRVALGELLEHRRKQTEPRFPKAELLYKPGETAQQFLARHGVRSTPGAGSDEVPYYVLIAGDPELIPFEFQYGLSLQCAVGRLSFDGPDLEESLLMYARYAQSVVESETGTWALPRQAVLFSVSHDFEPATQRAATRLVQPMLKELQRTDLSFDAWEVAPVVGELATKDGLRRLVGGDRTPALLFVSALGMAFPSDPAAQRRAQGSIVCSDWSGAGPIEPEAYLSGEDVPDTAALLGLVAFLFVPHGAGIQETGNWVPGEQPRQSGPRPFVSRLSQRLLGHPRGSALAVIGHVDTNWLESLDSELSRGSAGYRTFVNVMARLVRGHSVGSAMEFFSTRYRQIVSELADSMIRSGGAQQDQDKRLVIEAADIRNYIVLGDPAVRLPTEGIVGSQRPTIQLDPQRLAGLRASAAPAATPPTVRSAPVSGGIVLGGSAETADDVAPVEHAVFNGIDRVTGDYFYEALPVVTFLRQVLGLEESPPGEGLVDRYKEAGDLYFGPSDVS